MKTYRSFSAAETKLLGAKLAKKLVNGKPQATNRGSALVLALSGELGSGKTTFARGVLRGLGVMRGGTSPTFILIRRHALTGKKFKNVYHIDAYRIKKSRELAALGFKETITDHKNIVLIEWAENIGKILPRNAIRLKFLHGGKENERRIMSG